MLKYHIQTVELTSTQSSIQFNQIPQDFTDLYLSVSGRTTANSPLQGILINFNQVTSGYTSRRLWGSGSSVSSDTATGVFIFNGSATTGNTFGNTSIYICNYSENTNKPYSSEGVMETNANTSYLGIQSSLWSNTAPISSISIAPDTSADSLLAGTSVSLYGVKRGSDGVTLPAAIGGTVTTSGGYTIHTFNTSGTFTAFRPLQCEYLVVAGGGGAGRGGGGAGGLRSTTTATGGGGALESLAYIAPAIYPVIVGAGGTLGNDGVQATNGINSSFAEIVSLGGGFGGRYTAPNASNGGSGGGGEASTSAGTKGIGTSGQGFDGGSAGTTFSGSAGGGGAGQAGGNGSSSGGGPAGNGGNGVSVSISGSSVAYGGGGAGGNHFGSGIGTAGTGGGGVAGAYGVPQPAANGGNGQANRGGGGGGGSGLTGAYTSNGGNGGSGVVIIRYLTP
jgi:hypothetical protein